MEEDPMEESAQNLSAVVAVKDLDAWKSSFPCKQRKKVRLTMSMMMIACVVLIVIYCSKHASDLDNASSR